MFIIFADGGVGGGIKSLLVTSLRGGFKIDGRRAVLMRGYFRPYLRGSGAHLGGAPEGGPTRTCGSGGVLSLWTVTGGVTCRPPVTVEADSLGGGVVVVVAVPLWKRPLAEALAIAVAGRREGLADGVVFLWLVRGMKFGDSISPGILCIIGRAVSKDRALSTSSISDL